MYRFIDTSKTVFCQVEASAAGYALRVRRRGRPSAGAGERSPASSRAWETGRGGNMQRGFISFLAKVLLDKSKNCGNIHHADAAIAHLVERHLAKVEVASSSLVGRSTKPIAYAVGFFLYISAGMVELADTLDLGSSGKPCRFESCYPHHVRRNLLHSASPVSVSAGKAPYP